MPKLSICNDYFVRWPVKVDDVYAEGLAEQLSPGLVRDIRDLATWWQENFAVAITDPQTVPSPTAMAELEAREQGLLARLQEELGDAYLLHSH